MSARVLIIDQEKSIQPTFQSRLIQDGHEVWSVESTDEARAYFAPEKNLNVVILGLDPTPSKQLAWMETIRRTHPHVKILTMSQKGDLRGAVEALRGGALNYFEAPFNVDQISEAVHRSYAIFTHDQENHENDGFAGDVLRERLQRIEGKTEDQFWYVSKSRALDPVNDTLTDLRREAMKGGKEEPPVIITGKFGTGKEGIARMIHAGSRRGKSAWLAQSCAALREDRLELELFGHEKGAFEGAHTLKHGIFEMGRGGTLFLDDLEHLSSRLQGHLAQVLRTRKFKRVGGGAELDFDMRIIVGLENELNFEMDRLKFNPTLLEGLRGVKIHLPELKERISDLIPMATQFAERFYESRGKTFEGFTPEAEKALQAYAWPGNVYELFNVVSRAAVLSRWETRISTEALTFPAARGTVLHSGPVAVEERTAGGGIPIGDAEVSYTQFKKRWSNSFEQEYLVAILSRHGGNVSASAREAKLDRSNFLRLLRKHGLRADQYRKAA